MDRVLVIENDSIVPAEIDDVLDALYSDPLTCDQVKEINFAESNTESILTTAKVFSDATEKDDRFIVVGLSTFRNLQQVAKLLIEFSRLKNPPLLQFVYADQFVTKLRHKKIFGMTDELEAIIEDFIGKGLVDCLNVDADGNVSVEKLS